MTSPTLRTDTRTLFAPPGTVSRQIGFRVVRVPRSATGDVNGDALVDLADLQVLALCNTGPANLRIPGCGDFDFDDDADVDLHDWAEFQSDFDPSELP